MSMKQVIRCGWLIVLAVGLVGCAGKGRTSETSGNSEASGASGTNSLGANRQYSRLAVTSSTHVGFLVALGAEDCIVGMTDLQYAFHPLPGVVDLGSSINIDAERVMASGAEAILLSSYSDDEKKAEQMRKVGVEPIFIDEWKEETPLGRAAWIRQIGALVGKEREADSIYASVAHAYDSLRTMPHTEQCVFVMSGAAWQGTWYVPAGNTYMGNLFRDAHFNYAYASDSTGASIPLTFEQAVVAFKDADVWVGAPGNSLDELKGMDEHHTWFKAFQEERVYNFSKRVTASGANDFWETGVVHPELILQDLLLIRGNASDEKMYFAKELGK